MFFVSEKSDFTSENERIEENGNIKLGILTPRVRDMRVILDSIGNGMKKKWNRSKMKEKKNMKKELKK